MPHYKHIIFAAMTLSLLLTRPASALDADADAGVSAASDSIPEQLSAPEPASPPPAPEPASSAMEPAAPEPGHDEDETRRLRQALELRLLRAELDSVKALMAFHGIKPYRKPRVTLKASVTAEPAVGHAAAAVVETRDGDEYMEERWFASGALSFNLKASVNAGDFSPYAGAAAGFGFYALHVIANAGVEKPYLFNGGFSATPSLGAHVGACGFWDSYTLAGAHSAVDFAFDHGRFTTYLSAGARFDYVFRRGITALLFPLGMGMSLRI